MSGCVYVGRQAGSQHASINALLHLHTCLLACTPARLHLGGGPARRDRQVDGWISQIKSWMGVL